MHSTCIASPEAYLAFYESDDTYQKIAQDETKYASREAIKVMCKAYSTLHESNDTRVRDHFYSVYCITGEIQQMRVEHNPKRVEQLCF
jgi:hypothetical protein